MASGPPAFRSTSRASTWAFECDDHRLDRENGRLPDGLPKHPDTGVLLGVSVVTDNEDLGNAVVEMLGPTRAHFTLDSS